MAGMNPRNVENKGSRAGRNGKGFGLIGTGSHSESGAWHPTVSYLVLLVILEAAAFVALRYTFRKVHGG